MTNGAMLLGAVQSGADHGTVAGGRRGHAGGHQPVAQPARRSAEPDAVDEPVPESQTAETAGPERQRAQGRRRRPAQRLRKAPGRLFAFFYLFFLLLFLLFGKTTTTTDTWQHWPLGGPTKPPTSTAEKRARENEKSQ